jgi:hypothetical protein
MTWRENLIVYHAVPGRALTTQAGHCADPQLESAWFQALRLLKSEKTGSKICGFQMRLVLLLRRGSLEAPGRRPLSGGRGGGAVHVERS